MTTNPPDRPPCEGSGKPAPRERTERLLTKACIARLVAARRSGRRVWWFKVHGGPMQRSGVPDLCVVIEGRTVWLELKRESGTVSRLQAATMDDMRHAGAETFVVRTADEFEAVLGIGGSP